MTVIEAAQELGLQLPATHAQIKKAYRAVARRAHPDVNPADADAHRRMVAANEAFETLLRSLPSPGVQAPPPKKRRPHARRNPAPAHNVVWSGPPRAASAFFDARGFLVRPTDGGVAFRIIQGGRLVFTLERHRDDPALLFCRDDQGRRQTIDGVAFWLDTGADIVPYSDRHV